MQTIQRKSTTIDVKTPRGLVILPDTFDGIYLKDTEINSFARVFHIIKTLKRFNVVMKQILDAMLEI